MAKAPHILSVEEAGREIGIGRTLAYAQARAWLATGGAEGFPCRRIGRLLHVFRAEFEAWLGFEITWPATKPWHRLPRLLRLPLVAAPAAPDRPPSPARRRADPANAPPAPSRRCRFDPRPMNPLTPPTTTLNKNGHALAPSVPVPPGVTSCAGGGRSC